jgi:DNA recombination protein RmuC
MAFFQHAEEEASKPIGRACMRLERSRSWARWSGRFVTGVRGNEDMTDFDLFAPLSVLPLGILLGGLASWLVLRKREQAMIDGAVAKARAAANVELTAANLRARLAESNLAQLRTERAEAKGLEERLGAELASLKNMKTQLEERASRIPELERELAEARESGEVTSRTLADSRETAGREVAQLAAELQAAKTNLESGATLYEEERKRREQAESESTQLASELKGFAQRYEAEKRSAAEKLQLLMDAKEALGAQFKSLANDILEEKSKRFTEQNQVNLGLLLDPLRTRIAEFQKKVEQVYVQEGKDRSALSDQVRQLLELNQILSEDAKNLTSALKGSSRTQGSWGELVLERILEASGLRAGDEYVAKEALLAEDGKRQHPDVVINLPENRHLVIDAKVSLVAYERYALAETDGARQAALQHHLDAVRTHLTALSEKKYQTIYGLNSLDFALMFVPIEPAFILAATNDRELFMDAWQRNVLLVSPSTLLFVVRTVAHLWRQEAQSRNAREIAGRGAELYDKLASFVEDLKIVGERLKSAQSAYACAEQKLYRGKGNAIRQAEMLRDLGVKPRRQIPPALLDSSAEDEHAVTLLNGSGLN